MGKLILIMFLAGAFGGSVNYCQLHSKDYFGWTNYWKCVIMGLGASFLVPLFLQMISSGLVEGSQTSDKDMLVFSGFCLTASIFSRRFIDTIGEKILRQVVEAKETAEEAKQIAENNKEEVDLIASKATEVDPSEIIPPDISSSTTTTTTQFSADPKTEKLPDYDDFISFLKALKDTAYTFRTMKGIKKDACLNDEKAYFLLRMFQDKKWVKEIDKDGKKLYALTEEGNKLQAEEA